ncbi:MAG: invasin domain 3-containing protein [Dehalococcoidia bacterium]
MMTWRTLTKISAVGLVAAVALSVASLGGAPRASAVPTQVVTYSPDVCTILLAGTAGEGAAQDVPHFAAGCNFPHAAGGLGAGYTYAGIFPENIVIVAAVASQRNDRDDKFAIPDPNFGQCNQVTDGTDDTNEDDLGELLCSLDARDGTIDAKFTLRPADFAGIDLEANMIHEVDGGTVAVAFVNDDSPVFWELDLDGAIFDVGDSQDLFCAGVAGPNTVVDTDCDGIGEAGNGVAVAQIIAGPAGIDEGPGTVSAEQELVILHAPIIGVGEPGEVTFRVLTEATIEPAIQTGLDATDCPLPGTADEFIAELGKPEKTILVARVADSDDRDVTGALVKWETDDPDIAIVAAPLTPTIDLGGFGIGAPNILCGTDDPGTVTITATLLDGPGQAEEAGTIIDGASGGDVTELEFTVLGPPASLTLAAAPATIDCNGTNTASVTATVSDAEGNPVVDGVEVQFSVQVLGTANPIIVDTAAGVATSTITPLAATEGVPVVVTAGDAIGSILVGCTPGGAAPGTPPDGGAAPGGAPIGTIRPPDTGSGGDLDGRGALNVWMAVALFAGAMGLVGARLPLRRA